MIIYNRKLWIWKNTKINRYDLFVELNIIQHIVNIKNIKSKFLDKKFVHKKKFRVKL